MTPAELRALLAKATTGPWIAVDKDPEAEESRAHGMEFHRPDGDITREFIVEWRPNAALIVAAVNALPALLDVAEAARRYDAAVKLSEGFDCNHYEPPCNCGKRASEIDNRVEQALAELRVTLDMLGSK